MNYLELANAQLPRVTLDTWAQDGALLLRYKAMCDSGEIGLINMSSVQTLRDHKGWTMQRTLLEFFPDSFVAEVKARCGIVDAPVREERWNEETCQFEEAV